MPPKNPGERQIFTFRKPFNSLLTPYKDDDINLNVRRFCRNATVETSLENGKIIFIGNTGVGKSSLIRRFCKNKFDSDSKGTAGVDYEIETFNVLGVPFIIEMYAGWDTAGQERFKWITSSYYRGTNVIIVVFDLSDINTLHTCDDWLDEAEYENNHDFVFLVGNKLDSVTDKVHASMRQMISPVAEELGAEYWAVSSKSGKNVKHFFLRVALLTFQSVVFKELKVKEGVGDNPENSKSKISLETKKEENQRQNNCTC